MVEQKNKRSSLVTLLILLNVASIILLFSAVFTIQLLSIAYGTAAGALIQSRQDNMNVTPLLAPSVAKLSSIYWSINESYLLFIIALIIEGIAFLLLFKEGARSRSRYILMHASLSFIFIALYYIIIASLSVANIELYLFIVAIGIVLVLASDFYLLYLLESMPRKQGRRIMININPSTPFGNALELQEKIFSQLSGNLRIVDKHFNSSSLENLYRLISPYLKNISAIRIITSKEMLDKSFATNYNDLKAELAKNNVEIELRIMNDDVAREQHERFMFDSSNAYKIPPFNIITRKSEHIVKISLSDAKKRYDELYNSSTKIENYYSIAGSKSS
ncbi:MAG: hypothetical protein RXO35_02980 [Candidatus Micrarchaeota archaeon]